jgi:DNA-binding CsgD family transcriptional regulator
VQDAIDSRFSLCKNDENITEKLKENFNELGAFRSGIVISRPLHSLISPTTLTNFWGFDKNWEDSFRSLPRNRENSIEDHVTSYGKPVLWRDLPKLPGMTDGGREILKDFFRYHEDTGVSAPVFGPFGFCLLIYMSFHDPVKDVNDPRVQMVIRVGHAALLRYVELYREKLAASKLLSAREQDVLKRLAVGQSKKFAARDLGISANSVDTYLRRIFAKLNVNDRTEAVVRGFELGLISL